MKKFKLLLAAFVATLFAFVGGNAFADGATYSLTIKGTHVGHTYEAYQIFDGDISSDGKTLSNVKWGSDVTPFDYKGITEADKIAEEISKPGEVDENNETKAAKDFSKLAGAHLTTTTHKVTSTETTTVISGLAPGYYLVKDVDGSQTADPSKESEKATAYTRFIMQVVGNSEAQLKNDVPSVQKKVKENSNSEWQDAADYDINDTVPFQLKATLPIHIDDYEHYYVEFTDTLSAGLTFDKITLVKADNTILKEDQYQVSKTENKDGTTTLSVIITDVKAVSGISKDDREVTVEYNATLNDKAVLGSAGNPNSVELTYSNNPNATGDGTSKPADTGKTPKDTVKVFTYQTIINKIDQDGKALPGAGFTLYKDGKEFKKLPAGDATTFTFKGLDAGNYVLEESTTPDGYNTIKPIEFTINAEYDVKSDDPQLTKLSGDVTSGVAKFDANEADGSLKADIVNRKGSLLPSTGGMGTTILYVIGSILVLVAAVLLITKKRMDAAK
ncbi:LPXTG-motif cell wall anchor domain-containing protein/fimbrial isopeptide formation D2 domain-containing protein [Streptococcus equinus]|uniref:isopeptide-forming domain-containing fimbrial protein n=1 Tax=Streptococcus TaxID=1301 RepID=UPI000871B351|nr:isopeptide-forming domain-containing fimbrial protein [Streptococcus equinus]SCW39324.1 LPXTG-motif cell wall anchor domain-containing protein/fimbrial isopeptide formation D2 domain-containing protein [Streptococcus equinus]SEK56318.1 LPXTG-motif cell wall anchor domain-containing protein/fimbrial isopeptide formation D2 domain-containing protein [Streptococcus equinus]